MNLLYQMCHSFTKILKILLHNCHNLLSPVRSQQHYNCQHPSWLPPAHIQWPGYSPSLESVFHIPHHGHRGRSKLPHLGHNGRSYIRHLGFPCFLVDCGSPLQRPVPQQALQSSVSQPDLQKFSSQPPHLGSVSSVWIRWSSAQPCESSPLLCIRDVYWGFYLGSLYCRCRPGGCPSCWHHPGHLPSTSHSHFTPPRLDSFLLKMVLCKQPLSFKVKATFLQRFSIVFLFHSSSVLFLQNSYLPVRTTRCVLHYIITYLQSRMLVSFIICRQISQFVDESHLHCHILISVQ